MEKIKVSLILTTWNGEKKLKNALRSIKSQTYKNIELIICDDKSTDNSYEVLKNEVIGIKNYKIIKNKVNLGAWKNFINGVQRSKGDYICWMCQDDHWSCNYVEEIVIAINKFKKEKKYLPSIGASTTILTNGDKKLFKKQFIKYKFQKLNQIETISKLMFGIKSNKHNKINLLIHGLINKECLNKIIKRKKSFIFNLIHDRHILILLALQSGWCATDKSYYFRSLGTGEELRKKRDILVQEFKHKKSHSLHFYLKKISSMTGYQHMFKYSKSFFSIVGYLITYEYKKNLFLIPILIILILSFIQDWLHYFIRILISFFNKLITKFLTFKYNSF